MKNALFLALICLFFSACSETTLNVQAPQETGGAKSNFKTKSDAPKIERKLFESSRDETESTDFDDEDEATAALLRTADKMVKSRDYVSANVLYQRALGTNPESLAALKGLARMAEIQQKPQEALQAYRDMVRIDGQNADAHRGIAKNMMTLGLYDKAVAQLDKLRAIKGDDVETLNLQGMAYTRSEQFEKAIECFKGALVLEPDHINTQNNLGFTYITAGQLPDAIAVFEKLTDDPRATVQHRQNLALAYGLAGRENDARSMAMQDLPRSAVEKNIQSYRKMREKAGGKAELATKPKNSPKK